MPTTFSQIKNKFYVVIFHILLYIQDIIMTTGSAGGMAKPYKGMLPASAGTRPEYD